MYFDSKTFSSNLRAWPGVIGGLIRCGWVYSLEFDSNPKPKDYFAVYREWADFKIMSATSFIFKLLFLIWVAVVYTVLGFSQLLKVAAWLASFPLWLFFATTNSIKFGLQDYEQSWQCRHE